MSKLFKSYVKHRVHVASGVDYNNMNDLHLLNNYASHNKLDSYDNLTNNLENLLPKFAEHSNRHNQLIFDREQAILESQSNINRQRFEERLKLQQLQESILLNSVIYDIPGDVTQAGNKRRLV
jgi:hypothetical protein